MGIVIIVFSVLIIGILVLLILFRKKWMHKLTLTGIVTILGGLGTFLGIFVGLVKLDIIDLGERSTPSFKELIQGNLPALIFVAALLGIVIVFYLLRKLRKSNWLENHPISVNLKLLGMGVSIVGLSVFLGLVNLGVINLGISISFLKEKIQTNLPIFILVAFILTVLTAIFLLRKLRKSNWLEKHPIPVKLRFLVIGAIFLLIFIGLITVDINTLKNGISSFTEQIQTNLGTMISVMVLLSVITGIYFLRKLRKSEWLEKHTIPVNLKILEVSGVFLAIFVGLVTLGVIDLGMILSSLKEIIPTNLSDLITVVVISSMFVVIFLLGKTEEGKETIPSVVTILGILGTFSGIFIGLMAFDSSNIDESIPQFLSGVKTAFITSIAGISLSILFKIKNSIYAERSQGEEEETVTLETLAKLMTYQQMMTESGLREIVGSLSNKKEGPLLSQEQQQTNVAQHSKAMDKLLNELKTMSGEQPTESQKK